jgi:hypothetical protein
MPRYGRKVERQIIRGKNWTTHRSIDRPKYETASGAIRKVLGKRPMRFSELVNEVEKLIPAFPGSIGWYSIACLRELETQGKVHRGTWLSGALFQAQAVIDVPAPDAT